MTRRSIARTLLERIPVPPKFLDGIDAGIYEWTVESEALVGSGSSLSAAEEQLRAAVERKSFALRVYRAGVSEEGEDDRERSRGVFDALVPAELGRRIVDALGYEAALHSRGAADSLLFGEGTVDDWISASTSSWGTLAYEFARAADAVAAHRDGDEPVAVMALLALCRHHLELTMKAGLHAADVPFPTRHELMNLWTTLEPLMRDAAAEHWNIENAATTRAVIEEFDRVDQTGQKTRYPADKQMAPFERPPSLFAFSLPGFMEKFRAASEFIWDGRVWMELRRRRPRQ